MSRKSAAAVLIISVMAGLVLGYWFRSDYTGMVGPLQQKPAVNTGVAEVKVDGETPVIMEREFIRSHKVIISEFENRADIIGFTLDEIRSKYTPGDGFFISFIDGSLVIRQAIDDWTPEDKVRCRLGEYQGMVAIYIGPDSEHDSLMKVTAIRFDGLPASIKEAIRRGDYEFENEAEVNDVLENLDEYF